MAQNHSNLMAGNEGQAEPSNAQVANSEIIFEMLTTLYPEVKGHVGDLLEFALCDLRHFADHHQLSFSCSDQAAQQTYLMEK